LLIGVGLYALYQQELLLIPSDTKNDEVFGIFIVNHLPLGAVGLIIAAVLAAAMSTLSSSLNSSAGAFVADFYRPLRPGRDEKHYLITSQAATVFWGVAQTAVALGTLWLGSDRSIIDRVLEVAGFTTGLVLGLFILGSMRRPVRSTAALVGLGAGFLAVLSAWLPKLWGATLLAWPWFAPLGCLVTIAVALLFDKLVSHHGSSADGIPQPGLDQPG
jgi:Na+/proline symporter